MYLLSFIVIQDGSFIMEILLESTWASLHWWVLMMDFSLLLFISRFSSWGEPEVAIMCMHVLPDANISMTCYSAFPLNTTGMSTYEQTTSRGKMIMETWGWFQSEWIWTTGTQDTSVSDWVHKPCNLIDKVT